MVKNQSQLTAGWKRCVCLYGRIRLRATHAVYCSREVIIIETVWQSPTRQRFPYTWLTALLIWLLSLSPSAPVHAPTPKFHHLSSLFLQVCRTKEKRNITQRRWSTYKIYKVLHQNQLPRFMRTLICCCSALLFKAPWQCDCAPPFLMDAVSCVLCYTKSQKFIKRRWGCEKETAPQREIKDGDVERTEIDGEKEGREERAALLSNSPAKINPLREKQNILWNKTLASPSENAATFIYYSQVSDKCLEEMEKLSLQLCFLCLNSACAFSPSPSTNMKLTQHTHEHTRLCTTAGSVNREHLRWTWYWFYWLSLGRGMSDVCQTSEQKEETKLKIHHSDAIVFALVMINAAYRYSPSAITIKFISGCAHWPQWSLPERLSTTHKKSSALFFNSLSVCRELPGTCAELSQWHCSV